jgi:hypothetical protein
MAYNWVYFGTLGAAGLLQLFSITDEISSALVWLPGILVMYGFNILSANISTKSMRANIAYLRILGTSWAAIIIFILGQLGFWFSASTDWQLVIAFGTLLWFSVAPRLIAQLGLEQIPNSVFLFYVAPGLLCLIVAAGNRIGLADLSATKGDTTITINAGTGITNVRPITYLAKGVIYRKLDTQGIIYTQWDGAVSITMQQAKIERYRICSLFHLARISHAGLVSGRR